MGSDKKKLSELYQEIASTINLDFAYFPAKWPYIYRALEPAPGAKLVLEELPDQVVREVPLDQLANRIVSYMRLVGIPEWLVTFKQAREAAQMWRAIAAPLDPAEIKSVRWRGEAGYTWHRLPWDPSASPTPTWDTLLSRMTNVTAFKAWLGSLFFDDAKQHSYVWAHGVGGEGKGCINRFLARVFGRAYRSCQPPDRGDRFWTYGLIGARLVVFPDCNSQGFVAGGLFKSLTGGDPIQVEQKGQMSFTTQLACKFLFFSNEKPNISSENADMRRIIYCEFIGSGDVIDGFEERLWEEGGAFLTQCVETYLKLCPTHGTIPTETEAISDWVSTLEEQFELLFEQRFKQPNPLYRTSAGLTGLTLDQIDLVTLRPETMQEILKETLVDLKSRQQFISWLARKFGVRKASIKRKDENGEYYVMKRYVGLCLINQRGSALSTVSATSGYRELE